MGWSPLPPLPLQPRFRREDEAEITVTAQPDGTVVHRIRHAPLSGVTPEMLLWYLERVDREIEFRGLRALAYRFWHPRDHIHFQRLGAFGVGDRWHIVEAFQADPRHLMNETFDVVRLDETGFSMERRLLGATVVRMDEVWEIEPDGLRWTVTLTAGNGSHVLVGPLSRFIAGRAAPSLQAWHRHNVEEVSHVPHFLPEVYASRGPS